MKKTNGVEETKYAEFLKMMKRAEDERASEEGAKKDLESRQKSHERNERVCRVADYVSLFLIFAASTVLLILWLDSHDIAILVFAICYETFAGVAFVINSIGPDDL